MTTKQFNDIKKASKVLTNKEVSERYGYSIPTICKVKRFRTLKEMMDTDREYQAIRRFEKRFLDGRIAQEDSRSKFRKVLDWFTR